MSKHTSWIETGHCIRMMDEETGGAYWQTWNDSSRDLEPAMGVGEPVTMLPESFPLGCNIIVLEPRGPDGDPELTPNITDRFVGEAGVSSSPCTKKREPRAKIAMREALWRLAVLYGRAVDGAITDGIESVEHERTAKAFAWEEAVRLLGIEESHDA